jgi:hypothetical protein
MKLPLLWVLIFILVIGIFSASQNFISSIFSTYAQTTSELKEVNKNNILTSENIAFAGLIVTISSLVVSNIVTNFQNRKNNTIKAAEFYLTLRRDLLTFHKEPHLNLRPGGEWANDPTNRPRSDEMPLVEAYLGFFEHCNNMIDKGLIDIDTFKKIYGYRINNILENDSIRNAKLTGKIRESYKDFISLCKKLGLEDRLPK